MKPLYQTVVKWATLHFAILYLGFANAQCDATFADTTYGVGVTFTSYQIQDPGFTYYHTWDMKNSMDYYYTPDAYHSFSTYGAYPVCHYLRIEDSLANVVCADTSCRTVVVTNSCLSGFSAFNHSNIGLDMLFSTYINDFTNVQLRWDFGDGTFDYSDPSPNHTYPAYGQYLVCFYAYDTVLQCADSICFGVTVDSCQFYSVLSFEQPDYSGTTMEITDGSYGTPYQTMLWYFGDSTSSTAPVTSHTYPSAGEYEMCVEYSSGSCYFSNCYWIYVDSCRANFADFHVTPGSGYDYVFEADSLGGLYSQALTWDFGDGTTDNYAYAYHTYSITGQINVCLTVEPPGCIPIVKCEWLYIQCGLTAAFTFDEPVYNTREFTATASANNPNLLYKWSFGDGSVGYDAHPIHVYTQNGFYETCLTLYDTITGCGDSICYGGPTHIWSDTICGAAFIDLNLNGIYDTLEPPFVNAEISIEIGNYYAFSVFTDSAGYYSAIVPATYFINANMYDPLVTSFTLPFLTNGYSYNTAHWFPADSMRQCGFDFGVVVSNNVRIEGVVFYDHFRDSIFGSSEEAIAFQNVKIGQQTVCTNKHGSYQAIVPVGQHLARLDSGGYYKSFIKAPSSRMVQALTPGTSISGINLGVQLPFGINDLLIGLIPVTPVVAFGAPQYVYTVDYISDQTFPGTTQYQIDIVSDTALNFDTVAYKYTFTADTPATHTTTWKGYAGAFGRVIGEAGYLLSPTATLNQNLYTTATVKAINTTDSDLSNNTDRIHQIVVAPLDPNNKIAEPAGLGAPHYIKGDEDIEYVINFENLGTSDAINVVVKDVIEQDFDLESFRFIASHLSVIGYSDCDVRMDGDTVYFRFSGIGLQPNGKGWVAFAIKPKPNLPAGTQLTNSAAIYFDRNEPVITNTALHTIRNSSTTAINQSVCNGEPYTFAGQVITQSGVYYDTLQNSIGGDSIITLTLTIRPPLSSNISHSICTGTSYPFGGNTYSAAGIYTDTLASFGGCDSVVHLTLIVNDLPQPAVTRSTDTLITGNYTSYKWLLAGNVVGTAQKLKVTANGVYSVVVTDANGCSDTSAVFSVTNVDIAEVTNALPFTLMPNPANDVITLVFAEAPNGAQVKLTDMLGREVMQLTVYNARSTISLTGLNSGIYFVAIMDSKGRTGIKRLVVE